MGDMEEAPPGMGPSGVEEAAEEYVAADGAEEGGEEGWDAGSLVTAHASCFRLRGLLGRMAAAVEEEASASAGGGAARAASALVGLLQSASHELDVLQAALEQGGAAARFPRMRRR